MTKLKGKTSFVAKILNSTLDITGASKNEIITGIGIKHEHHLGLQLKLFGKVNQSDDYISCDFQILRSGNAFEELEKYVLSKEIMNVDKLKPFKEKYFRAAYFVIDLYVIACPIRFKIGDKAQIIGGNNKGDIIEIEMIAKYPDDPENHNYDTKFGAYYIYNKGSKKKDENLEHAK